MAPPRKLVSNLLVQRVLTGKPRRRGSFLGIDSDLLESVREIPELAYMRDLDLVENGKVVTHDFPRSGQMPDFADVLEQIDGFGIHPLFLRRGKRPGRPFKVVQWQDVFFVHDNPAWAIFGPDWIDPFSTALPMPGVLEQARKGEAEELDTIHYCGGTNSPNNPGHYVNDYLPRALLCRDFLGIPIEQAALPETTAPSCSLARDLVVPGVTTLEANKLYRVKCLFALYPLELVSHPLHFITPSIVEAVTAPIRAAAARFPSQGRAVYLNRLGDSRRKMVNEAELVAELEAIGVRSLRMSELSGREQFGATHGADVIVGPHGGALANILAARPGTRVVELFSPLKGTLAYAAAARACGLDYSLMVGEAAEGSEWRCDIRRVVDAVRDALHRMQPAMSA